jgi:hypothetical protein
MRPPQELLYDSEASLRLVDHAIEELSASGAELDGGAQEVLQHVMAQPGGIAVLSETLLRAYAETAALVARFRESAGGPDGAGIDKLQQMRGRLHEVSSATETATADILDGLGRAVALVEKLDAAPTLSDPDRHEMAASLREELGGLSNHLQFQDITSQQLVHIAALLGDMRMRLSEVVSIFGPTPGASDGSEVNAPARQDPWTGDCDQAVADEIFAGKVPRKSA